MAGWGDSGSHTGFGTALYGGFPCGFNTVGRLGPLHKMGQAVGLLNSGSEPKKSWYPQYELVMMGALVVFSK